MTPARFAANETVYYRGARVIVVGRYWLVSGWRYVVKDTATRYDTSNVRESSLRADSAAF